MEKIKAAALYFIDSMLALWIICSALRWDWINLLDPSEKMYLVSFIIISTYAAARNVDKGGEHHTDIPVNLKINKKP